MKTFYSLLFCFILCVTPQNLYSDSDRVLDYYGLLGVRSISSTDEIKKAYRKLAVANHPDKFPGDKDKEEYFKLLSEAWDVLGDESKRTRYDAFITQFGRNPTAGEFSTLDEFNAKRAAEAESEARTPQAASTHQSSEAPDAAVDEFNKLIQRAVLSYDNIKPQDFYNSFSKNHSHVEAAFLKILKNPKLSNSNKHLAFVSYYDTYAYSLLKKHASQLNAHNTLSLMNLLEAPLDIIQKSLGQDYVDSARSFASSIATEATLAHAQDGKFMGEMAQHLRNSKTNSAWTRLNIFARSQFDRSTTLEHIASNSTLYPILIKYLIADGDSKNALLLLNTSINFLNKMAVKIQSQELNEKERYRLREELSVIEELIRSKETSDATRKAKNFYLSETYVALKESMGEEVPVRHQSVAMLQSVIERGLESLNKLSGEELLDSKRGLSAFLANTLGAYRGVLHDKEIDKTSLAQAQGLIHDAINSSLHFAALKVPLDLENDLASKIQSTFKAQGLESLLSGPVATIFTDKISLFRKADIISFIEQNLRSHKKSNQDLAMKILEKYRNSSENLSTEILNRLLAQSESNIEAYRPLFKFWEIDLLKGTLNPFYVESKGLLLHSASLKKHLPKVAELANAHLVYAQRSLSNSPASKSTAAPELRAEILSNMKSSGYSCYAKLKAKFRTRK